MFLYTLVMRIVADSKIALAREAFSKLGEVHLCRTSELTPPEVKDARVLLVRSETRVDANLLEGSRVEFVGTATIGTDHVDQAYLQLCGIGFAAAPGSNARSVAEYVLAALLELAVERGESLEGRSLGVVGVGHIGSLVASMGRLLGMQVLLNDPPRARAEGGGEFRPLEDVLDSDFVTLHVPLEREGRDATLHLIDGHRLSRMPPESTLINTSRGPVTDNQALLAALERGRPGCAVLDVWEGEPSISLPLVRAVRLGTPHIAGYSRDGKLRGTRMIYESCCHHFGKAADWDLSLPPEQREPACWDTLDGTPPRRLLELVRRCYDIRADDDRLRSILEVPPDARAHFFRRQRREYPVRREFSSLLVEGAFEGDRRLLKGLGFCLPE